MSGSELREMELGAVWRYGVSLRGMLMHNVKGRAQRELPRPLASTFSGGTSTVNDTRPSATPR